MDFGFNIDQYLTNLRVHLERIPVRLYDELVTYALKREALLHRQKIETFNKVILSLIAVSLLALTIHTKNGNIFLLGCAITAMTALLTHTQKSPQFKDADGYTKYITEGLETIESEILARINILCNFQAVGRVDTSISPELDKYLKDIVRMERQSSKKNKAQKSAYHERVIIQDKMNMIKEELGIPTTQSTGTSLDELMNGNPSIYFADEDEDENGELYDYDDDQPNAYQGYSDTHGNTTAGFSSRG